MLNDPSVKFAIKMLYGKDVEGMKRTLLNTARTRGVSEEEVRNVFNHFGVKF